MAKKNPSWGGRFTKKPSLAAQKFSSSVETDKVLYAQDIAGSIAYAEALTNAKVLSKNEFKPLAKGSKTYRMASFYKEMRKSQYKISKKDDLDDYSASIILQSWFNENMIN